MELNSDIVFFDTETPNRRNDAICAFGAYRIAADGTFVEQFYSLADPEAEFTFDNVAIHGIEAPDVMGHPNFAELWDSVLEELVSDARLVAHGAVFDLTVLAKCLKRYRRRLEPALFADTRKLAEIHIPQIPRHALDNVASFYGFEFDHHHARSDAECCMRIFFQMEQDGFFSRDDAGLWHEFDFASVALPEKRSSAVLPGRANIVDKLPDIVERNAPNVELDGAVVCLTGDFEMSPYNIEPVIAYIESRGAKHSKNLTLSVDYLVVGNLGSPFWKHGSYGNKIATAMKWVETSKTGVRIVDEASITAGDFIF